MDTAPSPGHHHSPFHRHSTHPSDRKAQRAEQVCMVRRRFTQAALLAKDKGTWLQVKVSLCSFLALEVPEGNVWNALEEVWNGGGECQAT